MSAADYARFYEGTYRRLVSAYLGRPVTSKTMQRAQSQYANNLVSVLRNAGGLLNAQGGCLLDVGGSTGTVASVLAKEFRCKATVLDPSSEELAIASEMGHETVHALLEEWKPRTDDCFDLVFCCQTIDHFIDLRLSLDKLRSFTKPSGRVVVDIIDFGVVWESKGLINGAIKIDHCYYLSSENAPWILRNAGLEVVFSEIASRPEQVTYVCRPCEASDIPVHLSQWAIARTRAMQSSRLAEVEASAVPHSALELVRRKLYRWRQKLLRRGNQ
jgi:SAM-dependent methyltransferase